MYLIVSEGKFRTEVGIKVLRHIHVSAQSRKAQGAVRRSASPQDSTPWSGLEPLILPIARCAGRRGSGDSQRGQPELELARADAARPSVLLMPQTPTSSLRNRMQGR